MRTKKASEVIRRYRKGERKFCLTLRGESFQDQDLSDADFSEADIRGANFKGATLQRVKFRRVNAGLEKHQLAALLIVSFLLLVLSGVIVGFAGGWIGIFLSGNENPRMPIVAGVTLLLLSVFFISTIRQGLSASFKSLVVTITFTAIVVIVVAVATANNLKFVNSIFIGSSFIGGFLIFSSIAVAISISIVTNMAGGRAFTVTGVSTFTFIVAVIAAVETTTSVIKRGSITVAITVAIAVVFVTIFICTYVVWLALAGDKKYVLIRTVTIAFATIGGTSFRGADLTDADFTEATLESTDLREATVNRTCWRNTIKLDRSRLGISYLQHENIRQLLITGEGQDKNFDRLDLRGINLKGANLQDASFIGTELNQANLQNANLSRSKLVQTLLERTDLTRATLTGAYIENWVISNTTKLIEINCDYIFLKLPTKNAQDPQRRPADQERNFEPEEFAKLVQKITNTVDLVFKDGIDWQTFLKTFQDLRVESDTGELPVIQTIENKGDGAFVIRVKVPEVADEAEYERKFWAKYKPMLEAKDREIKLLSKQTEFYSEQIEYIRKDNTRLIGVVETMAEKETTKYDQRGAKINIGSYVDTAESGSHQQGYAKQTNYEAADKNLAEAAAEIQQLMAQLSQNNPTRTSKEKMIVVSEVFDKIENNPILKTKVINALKAGGVEAFKEAIDHPLVNVLMATIEGWIEA
ncbi:pentapeptide repeat-containing protein [Moorena sp. SIO3A2]|uniref:pentapeptide repeat-containing protein n=1 Tax=Moorena sp. SIO3A2 TaxID=2607841 RepID=UPI0013BD6BA1|nr:pentapeptide repeat-containing protein [Moorena sp. SIO3A2]NER89931.1 hypothetical protein [Moorena sp. SIO3A2]